MKLCLSCAHENPDTATSCEQCHTPLDLSTTINETTIAEKQRTTFSKGDVIANRYQVLAELGRGGMGVVYKVSDTMLGNRQCALKMVHPELVVNPEARKRFEDEVAICLDMHHPAIIQVYHLDRVNELLFFTMEYLQGTSLAELLAKAKNRVPPFSLAQLTAVITPLLSGLTYAHKYTIHRDIKPDNIMVLGKFPEISIKILDFGIARTMSTSRFTQTAQGMGTPYYMAPEQLDDAHEIDLRADLYSVGMVLYEMLTGEKAIGRFELPSELLSDEYKPIDQVIVTSLAPKAARRYPDAAAFFDAFSAAVKKIEQAKEEHLAEEQRQQEEEEERKRAEEQKKAEAQKKAEEAQRRKAEEEQRQKEVEEKRRQQEAEAQARQQEQARQQAEEEQRQQEAEEQEKKQQQPARSGNKTMALVAAGALLFGGGGYYLSNQQWNSLQEPHPQAIEPQVVAMASNSGYLTILPTPSDAPWYTFLI